MTAAQHVSFMEYKLLEMHELHKVQSIFKMSFFLMLCHAFSFVACDSLRI